MSLNFSKQLIKGKIAETIFEEMFRVSEEFTIIPLGYEHTTPTLAQFQNHAQIKEVLENIRSAPDFALISQDKSKVFLVEVKYRSSIVDESILEIAEETKKRWNPCFLFVANRDKFYFTSCNTIIAEKGKMEDLSETWIKKELQDEYLALLQEFIPQ
jgi:hypothetical protein